MASREHQGLQIALILFVLVTIALAVTTYTYYAKSERLAGEAQTAQEQAQQRQADLSKAGQKIELLKRMIGVGETLTDSELELARQELADDQDVQAIEEEFEKDMGLFGESVAQENRNYHALVTTLLTPLNKKSEELIAASARADQLQQEKTQVEQDAQKQVQAAEAGQQQAQDQLTAKTTELDKLAADLNKTNAQVLAARKKALEDNEKLAAAKQASENKLLERIRALEENTIIKDKLISDFTTEDPSNPDGQVTWVNQKAGLVWIDLGVADGLPNQISFSVYPRDVTAATQDDKKGEIEVVRLIDDHLAEARIINDEPSDPIMAGDKIYTPAWHPGHRVRFALAGVMDVNDDGESDLDLVKNLIALNGGVVDAAMNDQGDISGEISVQTTYLVQGEQPDETTDPAVRNAYTAMNKKADEMGVEQISLQKMLAMMGWKGQARTVGLGANAEARDFESQSEGGANRRSTGNGADVFRDRRPPGRGSRGAY